MQLVPSALPHYGRGRTTPSHAPLSHPLLITALITAGTVLRWAGSEERMALTTDPYADQR
jgi:hypothetical protein